MGSPGERGALLQALSSLSPFQGGLEDRDHNNGATDEVSLIPQTQVENELPCLYFMEYNDTAIREKSSY